jgi:predicted phage-related endonuclease
VDLAVLIGFEKFRVYTIERDAVMISNIAAIESEFWQRVIDRRPPEPTDKTDPRILAALYGAGDGTEVVFDTDACNLVRLYEYHKKNEEVSKEGKDQARTRILATLAEHTQGRLEDGRIVKRANVNVKEHTVKASSYTRLTIGKSKGD